MKRSRYVRSGLVRDTDLCLCPDCCRARPEREELKKLRGAARLGTRLETSMRRRQEKLAAESEAP